MKKFSFLAIVCALLAAAAPVLAATELSVFAAASMNESMTEIAEMYKKVAPDVSVVYNFDSSGTLKTQIEQGAECDIFISAGQKQMDQINDSHVMPGTRFNIVSNKVALIVPKGNNPTGIASFDDVATNKVTLVALGVWDKLNGENKISFASNVKEVLAQTESAAVSCGVVYGTDAATSDKVDVVAGAPEGSHKPIVYPAAILKGTKNEAAAKAFVEYLKGPEATAVFERIGFSVPEK